MSQMSMASGFGGGGGRGPKLQTGPPMEMHGESGPYRQVELRVVESVGAGCVPNRGTETGVDIHRIQVDRCGYIPCIVIHIRTGAGGADANTIVFLSP